MRVLMVAGASTGGLYAYTDALCCGLCGTGAEITVLTNSLWADLPRPFRVERRLFEFMDKKKQWSQLHWAADRFYRSLRNSLRRNRFAVREHFDVVHFQGVGTPLLDQFFLKPLSTEKIEPAVELSDNTFLRGDSSEQRSGYSS